jgi:hypothetical protein
VIFPKIFRLAMSDNSCSTGIVIPAKAGIQDLLKWLGLDSGFRRNEYAREGVISVW